MWQLDLLDGNSERRIKAAFEIYLYQDPTWLILISRSITYLQWRENSNKNMYGRLQNSLESHLQCQPLTGDDTTRRNHSTTTEISRWQNVIIILWLQEFVINVTWQTSSCKSKKYVVLQTNQGCVCKIRYMWDKTVSYLTRKKNKSSNDRTELLVLWQR